MSQDDSIEASIWIAAPVTTVFAFFADPVRFARWFGHGSSIAPERGGRIEVRAPMGPPAGGSILEWVEHQRIVFDFGHADGAGLLPPASTTVTVTFAPERSGTRVRIRHAGLPPAHQHGSSAGWNAGLSRLHGAVWDERVGDRLDGLVADWLAAWHEADATRRTELLRRCFAEDGVFFDQFAAVAGRDALHAWIGGVLQMMPGMHLSRSGAVQHVHGNVTYPWQLYGPDGAVVGGGVQFAQLDSELRLCRSVGFWQAPG